MAMLKNIFLRAARKRLNGTDAGLASTDTHYLLQRGNKNLAVADFAGIGCLADGFDNLIQLGLGNGYLDFYLGQKVHYIFGTAIKLGMAFLATKALDLSYRNALHAYFRQRLAHIVKLEGFNDCSDQFHDVLPWDGLHSQIKGHSLRLSASQCHP